MAVISALPEDASLETKSVFRRLAGAALSPMGGGANSRKINGAVYTPEGLAEFLASKLVSFAWQDDTRRRAVPNKKRNEQLRILDPACGDGALLEAVLHQLAQRSVDLHGARNSLCGVDVDAIAVGNARLRIDSVSKSVYGIPCNPNVLRANALFPRPGKAPRAAWRHLLSEFDAPNGFDIVIANPPWGATVDTYRDQLSGHSFALFQGQFDTSDLFVELGLALLKPGGYLGYIVPDSLFSFERSALRKLLVQNFEIRFLGRFGEKLFNGVNRACALVICRNVKPGKLSCVQCVRLTPKHRKEILAGRKTFAEAEQELAHEVPQTRFASNDQFRFDLDLRHEENGTISTLRASGFTFGDVLCGARGVELSKYGRIQECGKCGNSFPLQQRSNYICPHCDFQSQSVASTIKTIISKKPVAGYERILVGECINRYRLSSPLWIDVTRPGINYKSREVYSEPKLLVRKTGIGISATIDYSGAFTNQVVYIFTLKPEFRDQITLELLLAILNSRAMYYYLVKTHGETEWRSHPYVTQQQILELPLPSLRHLVSAPARRISAALRLVLRRRSGVSDQLDARIESRVADWFGLGMPDYRRIYRTLTTVEQLQPIQALVKIDTADIFS
jgi:adenine-specific DNA-methyltransferase